MSASSESRGRARPTDIIDLDRYMRGVRPSRHRPVHTRERLIVDAGGVDRLPVDVSSSSSGPLPRAQDYSKRFSHDSGVSDGSYLRQRHRPHRRLSENKHRESSRTAGSNSSVREFKAACERALREQQEQIARVTELCEKLVQPQIAQNVPKVVNDTKNIGENFYPSNSYQSQQNYSPIVQNSYQIGQHCSPDLNLNIHKTQCCGPDLNQTIVSDKQNFGQNVSQVNRVKRRSSPGTSDTSSSFSSRGIRMRDRHRSDSCKTYQLIMGKLDELSHMFATRRAAPGPGRESSSVLVCNKVVATEDVGRLQTPILQVMHTSRVCDRDHSMKCSQRAGIGPNAPNYNPMESAWNNNSNIGSAGDVFDLDNPLHLYAQAKRLQALHATNQQEPMRSEDKPEDKSQDKLNSSLCALCRAYWRAVRRYFKQTFFGTCT